jgi:hypothetical protein
VVLDEKPTLNCQKSHKFADSIPQIGDEVLVNQSFIKAFEQSLNR